MDVNGQLRTACTRCTRACTGRAHELESEIVEEHESEGDIEEHELRSE